MVYFSIFQKTQGPNSRERIFSGQRLSVIVKINNVGFPEA
jgi:hypothetical protein